MQKAEARSVIRLSDKGIQQRSIARVDLEVFRLTIQHGELVTLACEAALVDGEPGLQCRGACFRTTDM